MSPLYEHELALMRKREAAPEMYEAVSAFVERWTCGDRADTDYVARLMREALAKAQGLSA